MSAPTDELPAIEIEDDGVPWKPCWVRTETRDLAERKRITLSDLIALVAALPDEQRDRLLAPYIGEGSHISGRLLGLAERVAERDVSSLTAEIGAVRAELEAAKRRFADAMQLVLEYEAQWGDEYLAKKWELKEMREWLERGGSLENFGSGRSTEEKP